MAGMFGGVLQLVMSVILVTGVLVPILKTTNTTGYIVNESGVLVTKGAWTASEVAVFSLATLAAIFGLVNGIANVFGLGM